MANLRDGPARPDSLQKRVVMIIPEKEYPTTNGNLCLMTYSKMTFPARRLQLPNDFRIFRRHAILEDGARRGRANPGGVNVVL